MRRVRQIAIGLGIIVGLLAVSLAFGPGASESRNRKITAELAEVYRQWETNHDIPSLFQSLTNLPFHDGTVVIWKGSVSRRHSALGIKWEECYFIYQPQPITNASEWTLYHAWYWYRPNGGRTELAIHKLLTITTS